MKTLIPPLSLAYKKRVYSPARIRYPMKRVDFDPERRAQPAEPGRQQVRAHLLGRGPRHHHRRDERASRRRTARPPSSTRATSTARTRSCTARHGCRPQAAAPVRRLHPADPQPRQLGRLVLGRQARVGLRAGRPAGAAEQPALRHLQERRAAPLLGLRPGDHPLGLARPAPQPPQLLVDRAGHQADLHLPRPQLRHRRARRQVDPHPAQHRRRPLSGHRLPVVQGRHLRQGVPRDPRLRRRQVRGLRHGRGGRRAQDPGVGRAHHRRPRPHHQGPGRASGPPSAPPSSSATAAPASAAPTPPSRPACRCSAWPCRAWASRASTRPR